MAAMHNANQTVPAEYRNTPRLTNVQATQATRSSPRTLANKIPRSGNGRISHQVNGKAARQISSTTNNHAKPGTLAGHPSRSNTSDHPPLVRWI